MSQKKKIVGVFSFACDEGCSINLTEIFNQKLLEWLDKVELKYFLSVKERTEIKDFDIVMVEGVINTEEEKKELEEIRKNTKVLIAMGSCAVTGMPSGQRNNFSPEIAKEIEDDLKKFNFLPKALTIKEVVKVDDQVLGCPINEEKFIETFEKHVNA